MRLPHIKNTLEDPNTGVTWHVMAYRVLTLEEMLIHVASTLGELKRKRRKPPKRGSVITILTTHGATGGY